jgi:NarL family two-component system response regulator LiaR
MSTMEPARPSKLRVFLVDDHRVVADALARLLAAEPDIEVVGTASSVRELETGLTDDVDCALISYLLRDGSAAVATRIVKRQLPHARVVVLSRTADPHSALRAVRSGADAFLDGHATAEQMLSALRGSFNGSIVVPAAPKRRDLRKDRGPSAAAGTARDLLTPRELDVLRALVLGRTTRQMCIEMGIGNNTVRTHVQNISAKLRVHSRLEAVALATREHIV